MKAERRPTDGDLAPPAGGQIGLGSFQTTTKMPRGTDMAARGEHGEAAMKDDKRPDIGTSDKTSDDKIPIARRNFLLGAGTAVAAGLAPTASAQAQTPQPAPAVAPDT